MYLVNEFSTYIIKVWVESIWGIVLNFGLVDNYQKIIFGGYKCLRVVIWGEQ